MIISRAPLRISFVGGGTDLPDFYRQYPGRVISVAIDKFVYILVNRIPYTKKVIAKWRTTEVVNHASELEHTRIKHALLDSGIEKDIEIGSFADIPAKSGLGSSSSFSVALLKGLNALLGKNLSQQEVAEAACRLEIELLKEPIGKQDQYAAAFGGLNIIQFNPDDTVEVKPVFLPYNKKKAFQAHLLLFSTGITRSAGSVLSEQKLNIPDRIGTLKEMADLVFEFEKCLLASDFQSAGQILHQNWQRKKSLASKISNNLFDSFYEVGLNNGAWGGKTLGAGGGGCLLFIAPLEKQESIRKAMREFAEREKLNDFGEIPARFVECGADIVYRDSR